VHDPEKCILVFGKDHAPTKVRARSRGVDPNRIEKIPRETAVTKPSIVFAHGPVRAASILAAWAEQKAVREIMVFLHSHGVGTARAVRIFKTYGADAIQVMTENPYRLAREFFA
jgi:hypothetical protein